MITFLVLNWKHIIISVNKIKFQFAHCLESEAGSPVEGVVCFSERVFRRAFKRQAVLGEIRAQQSESRRLSERIHISG